MSDNNNIDYGPLTPLIGVWKGDKGIDVAPEPDGIENNPYHETLSFTAIGDVANAESQVLAVIHYRQIVQHIANDVVFHDQTGYWMWDEKAGIIMHSFTIPRAVCVLAGGNHNEKNTDDGRLMLQVSADINNKDWQIVQSPFMQKNARTTAYRQQIVIENNLLEYSQTTTVDIYGRVFEHTDTNKLVRQ